MKIYHILKAEILYCINYEFVKKPIDFLVKKNGALFYK